MESRYRILRVGFWVERKVGVVKCKVEFYKDGKWVGEGEVS